MLAGSVLNLPDDRGYLILRCCKCKNFNYYLLLLEGLGIYLPFLLGKGGPRGKGGPPPDDPDPSDPVS